jgi:hypothetical protein
MRRSLLILVLCCSSALAPAASAASRENVIRDQRSPADASRSAVLPLAGRRVQAAAPFPAHFLLLAQPEHLVAQLWLEPDDAP